MLGGFSHESLEMFRLQIGCHVFSQECYQISETDATQLLLYFSSSSLLIRATTQGFVC